MKGTDVKKMNNSWKERERLSKLPLSRVKIIVKTVPSVSLVTSEALASIGFLCEQFIQDFCRSVIAVTAQEGKKTITKQHVQSTFCLSHSLKKVIIGTKLRKETFIIKIDTYI
ncbi:unnamed protein product [Schistosoma margrebowiei]|uniref:Transcription factor CBF/NF-Y/archaeal histone domain-containing protein n=1 Tax=Schistosoma margrebowiei TaxID=48269 RepID=A0A3P7ZTC0_9TREM|nr:unnamed protein product [Schistosoma margrebowiei]